MQGLTRFKPAADWLAEQRQQQRNQGGAASIGGDLKVAFDQFVDRYKTTNGLREISARDQEALFSKFQQFIQTQQRVSATGARTR
jgi:hypothetical protein